MTINQNLEAIRKALENIYAEDKLLFSALTEGVVQLHRLADAAEKIAGADDPGGMTPEDVSDVVKELETEEAALKNIAKPPSS